MFLTKNLIKKEVAEYCLFDGSDNVFDGLAKLWIYGKNNPDIESIRDSWRFDIWKSIHDVMRSDGNSHLLSYKTIMENSYEVWYDVLANVVSVATDRVNREYPQLKKNTLREKDLNGLDKVCKEYFSWLAERLSVRGYVSLDEVYGELDELGLTETPDFD